MYYLSVVLVLQHHLVNLVPKFGVGRMEVYTM